MINSVSSIELPSSPYFQGEKLFYNDWKSSQSPSTININIIDHISGTIDRCINITSLSSQAEQDANAQQPSHTSDSSTSSIIIVHNQSVIFCDCELGLFISYDLLSYTNISYLTVKVKKGNCINNVECSRQNNILFYTITGDSLIHAIAIQDGRLNLLEDLKLSIPNNEVSDRKPNFILDPNRSHLLILSESGYIQVYDYSVWAKLMKKKFFDVVMDSNSEEHSESMDNRSASNQSITLIGAFDFPQLESNVPCKCTHWAVNHDFTILHAVYNRDVMCTYSLGPILIASNSVSSKTKIRPTSVYQNMSKSSLILSAALSPRGDYCYQLMQTDKIASSGSRPSSLSISARSLSDYTLPPLHCEDLVIDSSFPIVSHFCLCPISDRFILLTKSVDQKGRFMDATKVLFVAFSQWWRLKVCPTFVIAPLTLPLHNFKRESINNIGDKNSIDHSVLALVPSVDILDSSNLGSVRVIDKVYSFPISSKPSSKSAVFNFDTPSAAFVSPPTRITVDISNDDLLKVSVKTFFVPRDIISAEPWATIVIGNTFASNMDSFICSRFPSAYIHFNDLESKQCGFFTSFRSVVYWNPEESMPKTQVSSNSFLRHALLALSSDGTTLKYIPFMSPASGGEVPKAESFNLPSKVSEIWSPSTGSCRRVLFSLSAGPDTDLAQQLVISDANQIVFTSNKVGFQLLPKEKVLQVVWKSDGLIQDLIGFLTSQRVLILSIDLEILSFYNYLSSFQTPLIGEASGLAAVSSIQFAGSALIYITLSGAVSYLIPSYSGTQESDNELMITEYFQNVCLRESQNNIVKTNILFKLPLKMSVTGSVKLSCIFSDRIVLMYNRNTARINDPHVHMTVRPVMLGEPILLSLISQSERSLTEDASIELFQTMIDSMRRYFDFRYLKDSNKSPPLSHLSNKLLVAVHSFLRRGKNTQTVATQSIFDELKLIFIDLLLNLDEDIVPPFPRAKWTLPGVSLLLASLHHKISSHSSDKAIIPKKGKTGATTSLVPFNVRVCAEFFINHRPDLVDILFEPSVHSGSGLLPPLSAVAKQCSAMSRVMLQEGLFEIARIFADFAGDDSLVFLAMICECSKMEENSYGKPSLVWIHDKIISRKGDFLQFKRSLVVDEDGSVAQAKIFYSLNILEDITKQLENGSHDDVIALMKSDLNVSISEIFSFTSNAPQREQYSSFEASTRTFVTVQSLCGNQNMRRAALQILTNGALDSRISWLAKDRVNEVSKKHIEMASKPMDSTSIVSSYYLMDAVEEWLCLRCFPELHSPSDLFSKVGKSQVTAHNILEDESRPSTWVEGVGAGKADWEKLAAYWRFSDPIGIKDELFISTGLPASRLCLPDLSKYGRATLEVFASSTSQTYFEATASPCDSGDGHDKVKTLYDYVVHGENYSELKTIESGMRVVVGRGSPLDIGMYHKKARDGVDRNKMTVELWTQYTPSSSVTSSKNQLGHCLVSRNMGAPNCSSVSASESDGIPIWCLYVNDSGSVCFSYFSCEDSPRKNESIPIFGRQMVVSTIQTNSDVMKMNKPSESHEGSLQPESPWTHVSVVVDNSNISIYINGNCEVKGSLAPPVIDEKYLAISTLYFGLNLVSGWRLTELRIWADARSGNDIAQNKDNYLALAAKRKRLLLNFTKGPKEKELFLKPNIKPTLDAKPATTTSSIDLILNNTSNPKAEKALSAVEGLSLAIEKPKIQPIKFDAPVGSVSTAAVRRLQAKQSQPQAEEPKQEVAASSLSLNETAIPTILEKETAADSNIIPSLQESLEPVDSKQPKVSSAAAKRLQSKLQKPLS